MHDDPILTHDGWRLLWQAPDGHTFPVIRGGDGPETDTLEQQIIDLRGQIRDRETEEARKREQADEMLEKYKNDGITLASATEEQFTQLDGAYQEPDRLRDEVTALKARLEKALNIAVGRGRGAGTGPRGREDAPAPDSQRRERMVDRIRNSPDYERLREAGSFESNAARINTDPIEVLSRDELHDLLRTRTTVDIPVAGSLVVPDIRPEPVQIPVRQIRILDLITIGDTDSNTVEWVKQTVRGDVAGFVPFGTALPEADYEFTLVTNTVQRLGQFVPATKGMLADAGQLQTLLESQLQYGVRLGAENEVLQGNGATNHLQGILGTSGINVVTKGDGSHSTENDLDAIHRGITAVRLGIFDEPTGIAMHPTDIETINLLKDGQGRYIYPPGEEIRSIWGFPPVTTALMPVHTSVVAAWRWATLWLRAGVETAMSDSHSDFFTRGLVAILAEMRAAFAVQQPAAFTKVVSLT